MRNVFYFSKKVRLFSQNDVLFLFYFLINPAGTTDIFRLIMEVTGMSSRLMERQKEV